MDYRGQSDWHSSWYTPGDWKLPAWWTDGPPVRSGRASHAQQTEFYDSWFVREVLKHKGGIRTLPRRKLMGYKLALEAAGWKVHAFQHFGDYSGTWLAIVSKDAGPREVIRDSYGSCTVCDSFQAEFEDSDLEDDPLGYVERLKAFGERYTALPFEHELMPLYREIADCGLDMDEEERLEFLTVHREGAA